MRKTLITLLLLSVCMTVAAQYEKNDIIITPMAGASIAWMAPNATNSSDEYSAKTGLTAGVEAEYMLSRSLGISAGLAYSQMGRKKTERKCDFTEKIDYLNIPLMVNYHVCKGLVNMNGRMYDYNLGRFLSPDNYVQLPHDSQSFNRYSYCLNNPLKSGKGNFTDIFTYAYKGAANDLKATFGMFFKGTFSQILSRFTFEAPQTAIGSLYTHAVFLLHDVDHVRYFDGATYIINISSKTNGVTIGNFININLMDSKLYPKNEKGDFDIRYDRNGIFMHEYGHYLQSQQLGWIYVFKVGIPSLISAIKSKEIKVNNGRYYLTTHKLSDVEIDANRKAERYFREKYDFHQWNIYEFPLFYDSHANWIGYPSRTSYFNYNPFKLFMTNY